VVKAREFKGKGKPVRKINAGGKAEEEKPLYHRLDACWPPLIASYGTDPGRIY